MSVASFDITSFKAQFEGGARSYLFYWVPDWPSAVSTKTFGSQATDAGILVRSTTLPGDNVEEIMVNWQGADLKMPGKRVMGDWTVTLNTDRKADLRRAFNEWMIGLHNLKTGDYGRDYCADQTLEMLDYEGNTIRTVKIADAWVKSVGPIELDYSAQDIAMFDVTFSYLHQKVTKSG